MRWLAILLLLSWLYSRTLPEPHPCDVMLVGDGAFADVDGCKRTFEVPTSAPRWGESRAAVEAECQEGEACEEQDGAEGERPLAEGVAAHSPASPGW